MTEDEIELEVQARVEFKMNQLLVGVRSSANRNWDFAFNGHGNPHKQTHYWEAFEQMCLHDVGNS